MPKRWPDTRIESSSHVTSSEAQRHDPIRVSSHARTWRAARRNDMTRYAYRVILASSSLPPVSTSSDQSAASVAITWQTSPAASALRRHDLIRVSSHPRVVVAMTRYNVNTTRQYRRRRDMTRELEAPTWPDTRIESSLEQLCCTSLQCTICYKHVSNIYTSTNNNISKRF
jgi:hypothetical protein